MSKISRRGLFGLGAGAAVVPFIKPSETEAGPSVTVFHSTGTWTKPEPERVEIVAVGGGGSGGFAHDPDWTLGSSVTIGQATNKWPA